MLSVVEGQQLTKRRSPAVWMVPILCLGILVVLASVLHRSGAKKSTVDQFWSPALSTSEPVLICLAKPAVYLPSAGLLQKYSKVPGAFTTELQRLTQPPPMHPQDKLVWGEMVEYADYGVAAGDVYAAVRLSALLGRMGKESQVRIGSQYSFADLRNSPAVVVGAFNNRWTMRLTSALRFHFQEDADTRKSFIGDRENPGRKWMQTWRPGSEPDADNSSARDYAVVARVLDPSIGQMSVVAAGLALFGTLAAGEFLTTSSCLDELARHAPPGWETGNVEVVIATHVIDGVSGPPKIEAIHFW